MADPRIKQLTIKTGVVKRLAKEKVYYEKEVIKEEERWQKFKDNGKDEYELGKQTEVINDTKQMIPDTRKRAKTASEDLKNFLESEADLAETKEYKEALKQIEEAEKVL